MQYPLGIHPHIILQLQEAATAGKSATELLVLWQSGIAAMGGNDGCGRDMRDYFDEAFQWGIRECAPLGARQPFGQSTWTDEMINNRMAPLLEEWRTNPRPRRDRGPE